MSGFGGRGDAGRLILPNVGTDVTLPLEPPPTRTRERERRRLLLGAALAGAAGLALVIAWPTGMFALGKGYSFLHEANGEPVTWDHCQAIEYTVNTKGAPDNWREIVARAIGDIEEHSGFVFADRGTTVKRDLIGSRYPGNEWEPVLIMWSDRYQDQGLEGSTIGFGGSAPIQVGTRLRYVVGLVVLDSNITDETEQQLVLEHELGHVLGLDHTGSSGELMYEGYHGQDGLGRGDIAGLKKLHDVPCN